MVGRSLTVLLVASLVLPGNTSAAGAASATLVGASATYVVEAQGTDLNGTAFDERETLIATIASASATTLGIDAGVQGRPTVHYLMPIGAAVTPIAPDATPSASGLSYSRTYPAQYMGHAIGADEVITLQGGWVSEIDIAFTGIHTRSFTLQVVATTGPAPVPAGSVLWILPMLMSPNAGVTVAGSPQGAGSLAAAGPAPRTLSIADGRGGTTRSVASDGTISMISGIYAYDNPEINRLVWHSTFTVTGTVVNGAFTNFLGDMEPRADLPNWSCEGYHAYFALATTTEGDGVGQGYFSGWFPYPVYAIAFNHPSSDAFWWQATTTHYNYLRLTDETITLQAEVDEEPLVGGNWSVWKQPTLMNQAVFPNDGTEHDASFYVAPQNQ